MTRAAREEDGWNAFVSTAAWWLGENANELCDEFAGRKLTPTAIPAGISAALPASTSRRSVAGGDGNGAAEADGEETDDPDSDDREADAAAAVAAAAVAASAAELMQQFGGRSPTLSRIMLALQNLMLTAAWQLRLAAAQVGRGGGIGAPVRCHFPSSLPLPITSQPLRCAVALPMQALAKIAVRSGEPYRLQCYSILGAACGAGGGVDALGLQSVTRPALALLDRLYATQVPGRALAVPGWFPSAPHCVQGPVPVPTATPRLLCTATPQVVLDQLWAEHGEDPQAWPKDVVASLGRRNAELARQVHTAG